MERRRFLATAGIALGSSLVGCLSGSPNASPSTSSSTPSSTPTPVSTTMTTPQATGTHADTPDGPEAYPDRPEALTRASVRQYVEDFEYARTVNVLHAPDVEEISVESRSVYDTAGQGGHYALAACRGYANYADNSHADWGQLPALYFVGPELTVRVERLDDRYFHCTEVFAADDPEENFAEVCEGGDATYRVYNLHPKSHTVSVTVEFLEDADGTGGSTSTTVLERTYGMGPATGVEQESVTYRRGTYRLTAGLEDGPETTYRWDLQSAPTYEDPPVSVIVTPVGGIAVRRPPFPEL